MLISVQDAASQTWPAPEIHDYTGGPVASWSPVKPGTADANTANFVLRDTRLRIGDSVMPFWRVAGNADQAIPPITVRVAGEAQGAIPSPILAASLGKTAEVFYAVNQSGAVRPVSEVLSLQVVTLPATALSELVILEGVNGGAGPELDVSGATTATLRLGVWPLIAEGQPVWLSLSGTKSDGSPYSAVIWAAGSSKVNASWVMDDYWPTNLPIAELKQLKDGSALTITFKAGLDGTQVEANAVTFMPKVYTVRNMVLELTTPYVADAHPLSASRGTVNLLKQLAEIRVVIPEYKGMTVGDEVSMHWAGALGAGSLTESRRVNYIEDMVFAVRPTTFNPNIGRTVSVTYSVNRGGVEMAYSAPYTFTITQPVVTGGIAVLRIGSADSYFSCQFPSTITVPESLPIGSEIALSSYAHPSWQTDYDLLDDGHIFYMNENGPQPPLNASVAETSVKGVGFILWRQWEGQPEVELNWRLDPRVKQWYGNEATSFGIIQLIKTGPVIPGTLQGVLARRYVGSNRFPYMHYKITRPVTILVD